MYMYKLYTYDEFTLVFICFSSTRMRTDFVAVSSVPLEQNVLLPSALSV